MQLELLITKQETGRKKRNRNPISHQYVRALERSMVVLTAHTVQERHTFSYLTGDTQHRFGAVVCAMNRRVQCYY